MRSPVLLIAALVLAAAAQPVFAEDAPRIWRSNVNIRSLIESGGTVGIVIMALSVGMVALMIEQLFALRRRATVPHKLAESALKLIGERRFQAAATECRASHSLLGFVLSAGLGELARGYPAVEKAMEDACAQYAARLYRKIEYFSVIGAISPMLGLLGTVWGMMLAFSEFASKTNVQVTELAPGISTALVTTLLGLVVAIPAYSAFAYFRNRVDEAVSNCGEIVDHLFLDYRRTQAIRRRRARSLTIHPQPDDFHGRATFPPVAIEREKSA